MDLGIILAVAGGAIATFLSGTGSAIGLGVAGRAASGVLSEDPTKFGRLFLLALLPSTQGLYGFIITLFIMLKLGMLGGAKAIPTTGQGWQLFFATLPVAVSGLFSAIHQGKVCAAGIQMAAKQPADVMKPVIYAVMVEMYAIIGFLVSLLFIMVGITVG